MLGLLKGMDAAAVRAFARANNIPVGSRGAPPDFVYRLFVQAQLVDHLKRTGRTVGRLALSVGPPLVRAANDRRTRQQP